MQRCKPPRLARAESDSVVRIGHQKLLLNGERMNASDMHRVVHNCVLELGFEGLVFLAQLEPLKHINNLAQ